MMTNLEKRKLVTTPSLKFLLDMVSNAKSEIVIVSPWIKFTTLQKVINATNQNENIKWKVLSRANHDDFHLGSSDIEAFKLMVENKSFDVRAIKQLHAKVYIVDGVSCLVTSANLTVSGMEINTEAGFASTDSNDLQTLLDEFTSWFNQANLLDKFWLDEEQKKLLETKTQKPVEAEIPFDPTDYHHPDEDDGAKPNGKYRELPLPKTWIPTLDALKEVESANLNHLTMDELIKSIAVFYEYAGTIYNGERTQKFLISRFIDKRTLESIGDEYKIERERISQIIGKRKNTPDNIWNSAEGKTAISQVSSFLNNAVGKSELICSSTLSPTKLQSLGLSHLDLCKFICGMIDEKIIDGNYQAKITPTNQLAIINAETFEILKKLDHIFHADYQKFMGFEEFLRLGELENITDAWFSPSLKLFTNLYLTKSMKIGSKKWSIEKTIKATAWELADKIEYYHWHYSEMREALKYLFPARFKNTNVRLINTRLSASPDKFQYAGSKGIWQLKDLGDGYNNNKDAITSILLRMSNAPLNYKEIIKELRGMGRRVNEGSIYALLERDDSFTSVGQGKFCLKENVN